MTKLNQHLRLLQRISPQQIQFIKLLQIPTAVLEQRVKEELERNPALEDENVGFGEDPAAPDNDPGDSYADSEAEAAAAPGESAQSELSIDDYIANHEYDYRTHLPQNDDEDDDYEAPIIQGASLYDLLTEQIHLLRLSPQEFAIGEQIIGSIDENGYLSRPVKTMVHHMAFYQNMTTTEEEVEQVLRKIQGLEPAGIAARDLQECLLLQLERKEKSPARDHALTIVKKFFEELSKRHFAKIEARMGLEEAELRDAYDLITHLNPKPGDSQGSGKQEYIIPDFILTIENDKPVVRLNGRNAPELKVSRNYLKMYQEYKKQLKANKKNTQARETLDFVKQRIESAQWFIDAIRQRQYTLLNTMTAIAERQRAFFVQDGDEKQLRPMILKDIADDIGMDISTVSRVANSKYVQTDFGILPLKFFFTEGIETADGEMVSNREVKRYLEDVIGAESKKRPLSDDKLADMLKEKGYDIARRTVAKYREQLGIPVARLRKQV